MVLPMVAKVSFVREFLRLPFPDDFVDDEVGDPGCGGRVLCVQIENELPAIEMGRRRVRLREQQLSARGRTVQTDCRRLYSAWPNQINGAPAWAIQIT